MKFTITNDFIRSSATFHQQSLNSRFHNQLGPNQLSQLRGSLQTIAQHFSAGFLVKQIFESVKRTAED
ncbi:MAG: hypothetical protein WAL47_06995, partial [Pyrinomonadaceae bacterium]